VDVDDRVLLARVIKNALGRRGLSGVDVGDDSDVSDVGKRRGTGHGNFRLDSVGWAGETPVLGDFRAANSRGERGNLLGRVAADRFSIEVIYFQ
jgi:hypothetical protein